jgi:HPt (histidine-containing phosphotransfer) domain-containing protein
VSATSASPEGTFFARLRAEDAAFSAGLPAALDRLAALHDPAARAPAISPLPAASAELRHRLHTLSGCAATFGYRRLGVEARALEQRLRVLQAFDAVPDVDWIAWFAQLAAMIAWARVDPRTEHATPTALQLL